MGNLTISESSLFSAKAALLGPIISLSLGLIVFGQYLNILSAREDIDQLFDWLGFYLFLFGLSTCFLLKNQTIFHRQLHLIWTTCLFLISTSGGLIEACSQIRGAVIIYNALKTQNFDQFFSYMTHDKIQTLVVGLTNTCFIVANCIADSILIYRCYIVWGSKKSVVALPILASIATNSLGLLAVAMRTKGASDTTIEANFHLLLRGVDYNLKFLYINATVNFVLTLMIVFYLLNLHITKAGRIWWVCRQTRALMDNSQSVRIIGRKYYAVIATLLECGILYPVSLIIQAAIQGNASELPIPVTLTPAIIQLAGIAPTLILVCTWVGRSITEEVVKSQNTTSTIQYNTQGRSYVNSSGQQTQIGSDLEFQAANEKHLGLET
ncbi:hypothetical protein K435DRAFT_793557 [Dendrothele bispora CBS 962.96]|uniref:Uncharacterized protein n=1 Tax=Dendrothele bispora (strain CBS 962.96) TaxID=1314807 RepID=A0A4V4HH44_DENBC|nr:hypothetical protein K435DRAFT_793557 [Dendrothele bispora CBS 962.96]